ncbi:MAG: DEAD/DEAH box helicase [[Clostridium] spiroforme]|uniref:DEAD/DEAH box helicase n=1 Tax=Thomasclavelia spiroformis TaxID=29348 RepID=A0A943EPT6_9FIRM|nr:DEAD/DEAH box helicase [Thomasclavelia spiroformis]MBS5588392.1 DEAD/DEAH box helicase [Thomasclavelia spiroformis]
MESKTYIHGHNKKEIRTKALEEIYNHKELPSSILDTLNLDVYSKANSFYDRLNRAMNKSFVDNKIILSNEQVECIEMLSKGNLFISAPTSFGKTFIALEYISRHIETLNNIVFIVPTISLMNEIRKKCFHYFSDEYVCITSEAELDKNLDNSKKIMILVPERINTKKIREYLNDVSIDFAVYDEIYKLNVTMDIDKDNSRLIIMNQTYKYLIENAKKLLLLGPFIKDVSFERSNIKIKKYITNLNLVYNEIKNLDNDNYLNNNTKKQFVYFKSPKSITNYLKDYEKNLNILKDVDYDNEIVKWMIENVHKDWDYIDFLKKGIGIHHGNTPIFLRKYIEEEYSNGFIKTILCTSTLIEGINTPTNKLIVYDTPRSVFELNNLIGRVGRLNINSPTKGEIYFLTEETKEMYSPDEWIELNILYEQEELLSSNKEDEALYLEKKPDMDVNSSIDNVKRQLKDIFHIEYKEVLELGIEFNVLKKFLEKYNEVIDNKSDFKIINLIKFDIIPGKKQYLSGLKIKKYSFWEEESEEEYLEIDPVYLLLVSTSGIKGVIDRFEQKYPGANKADINLFIDTVFKADEFIKFQLSKIIPVFTLFDNYNLLDKEKNKTFIQCVHLIEAYGNIAEGYERILEDMGFPNEDILLIINEIQKYETEVGTERKIMKLIDSRIYDKLSPFGKRIIESYNNY